MVVHRLFGAVRISFGHRSEDCLMGLISDLVLTRGQCHLSLIQQPFGEAAWIARNTGFLGIIANTQWNATSVV